MGVGIFDRLAHGWNAFKNTSNDIDDMEFGSVSYGPSVTYASPTRSRYNISGERSILSSIYTRIAIDTASIKLLHIKQDDQDRFLNTINSDLNNCLNVEANIDQAGTHFRQDVVMTLLEQGIAAIVPVETTLNPEQTGGYDIKTLRVGIITAWYPKHVTVNLYNELRGIREDITLPKSMVAIVENPLYAVMNEPNSTYQRLARKLNLLDVIDEQTSSGKLDIIIQLPYVIKNETKLEQAQKRTKNIEMQLKNSKYGVAYVDGSERITQLNRPAENNMLSQVEYLTNMLYAQSGITEEVLNGTASEAVMLNYHNRTIKPIIKAIAEAMSRTFLTKTARTQGQTIAFFQNPFELTPISELANMADKFTRNEIMTSNEFRGVLAMRPVDDARADQLVNKNMPTQDVGGDPALMEEELAPGEVSVDELSGNNRPAVEEEVVPGKITVKDLAV